jgi:PAS domain S-box-containing protein
VREGVYLITPAGVIAASVFARSMLRTGPTHTYCGDEPNHGRVLLDLMCSMRQSRPIIDYNDTGSARAIARLRLTLFVSIARSGHQRMTDHTTSELEAILAASRDAIYSKSLDNIVTSWGAGAEEMYGYTAREMVGQSILRLVPPDMVEEALDLNRRVREGQKVYQHDTRRITKSGDVVEIGLTLTPITDTSGAVTGIVAVATNFSALREAERAVERLESKAVERALVLETASRVALDILASRTGVEALSHIADAARALAHAQYAALGVASADGQTLQEFITVGLTPEEERAIGPRPRGAGVLGLLLKRTDPLRIDRLADHPASVGFPPNHPPMDSFLGVPIRRGDAVLGSLYLSNKDGGGSFTVADEVAVQALGAHAAVAIHNLQLLSRQRALVSGLINAQEEERRAIAYDLHDGLTQYVMASHIHLEAFRMAHQQGNEAKAAREIERGVQYLQEAVLESRRLVNGLRSLALDDLGLAGALEQLLAEEKARTGWEEVELAHNIADQRFDRTLETTAYRVVQEALANVRKHAETSQVRVVVLYTPSDPPEPSQLAVEIRDWGKGFNPDEKTRDYHHLGLQGMIERVHLIGGKYELRSAPGAGTTVHAWFRVLPPATETESEGSQIE